MKSLFVTLILAVGCLTLTVHAASVGPAGYNNDFTIAPPATDWSTANIAGAAGDFTNTANLDVAVAAMAATSIATALNSSNANPPNATANAVWCSAGYLQTRATGVRASLLMATLANATGSNVTAATISFNFTTNNPVLEQVPGLYAYYSLTGAAGSWVNIPEFSSQPTGLLTATLGITWNDGNPLYLLFVDDNATATPDTACQIDNLSVTTSGGSPSVLSVTITAPTEGASFVEGINVTVNATSSGAVTSTDFYDGATLVGTDTTIPFSAVYSNLTLGAHSLKVVGTGGVESPVVHINILANNPPTVALTTAPGGTVLVGSNIVNTAVVTDTDPGGSIARVEFFLDGALKFTDTTSPYTYEYCDSIAGTHLIQAVAVDHLGARGTNGNTLIATNPADVSVIIPNGSTWKYLDKGTDQGTAGVPWAGLLFDDTGWSNGVAELGYGDNANNRPETTVISFGPSATAKYPTTYFRKSFTVASPASITNLIVRLLRDDAAIVYINGTDVFRSSVTNLTPVLFSTYIPPAVADDGTFYQVTNVNPAVLVPGLNVVAVELHQDSAGSSDISFDLMLWAQPAGPSLKITRINTTQVDISWPLSAVGYLLEYNGVLNGPNDPTWQLDTDLDVPDATDHHVTVNHSALRRFFRLRHP